MRSKMVEGCATEIWEDALNRWVFCNSPGRLDLLSALHLPRTAHARFRVIAPFIPDPNRKPGDIDVLACGQDAPEQSAAIETKRLKVRAEGLRTEAINKVPDAYDGIKQVEALYQIGFHQTYFVLYVVVDGGRQEGVDLFARGLKGRLFGKARQIISTIDHHLRREVGFVAVELTQTTERDLDTCGSFGFLHERKAMPRSQVSGVTDRVREFFAI